MTNPDSVLLNKKVYVEQVTFYSCIWSSEWKSELSMRILLKIYIFHNTSMQLGSARNKNYLSRLQSGKRCQLFSQEHPEVDSKNKSHAEMNIGGKYCKTFLMFRSGKKTPLARLDHVKKNNFRSTIFIKKKTKMVRRSCNLEQ